MNIRNIQNYFLLLPTIYDIRLVQQMSIGILLCRFLRDFVVPALVIIFEFVSQTFLVHGQSPWGKHAKLHRDSVASTIVATFVVVVVLLVQDGDPHDPKGVDGVFLEGEKLQSSRLLRRQDSHGRGTGKMVLLVKTCGAAVGGIEEDTRGRGL